ncbi:MAG: polymer-forming cytoskeletal protein [Eubacterium sp.]|nr:polymer-forming cytoskeletal protein [Eubacterium sp.]
MAKYKEAKRDFAHAVSQLAPEEQKKEKVEEEKNNFVETEAEDKTEEGINEVEEVLIEEVSESEVPEVQDMSEIYIEQEDAASTDDKEPVEEQEPEEEVVDEGLSEVNAMNDMEQEIRSSAELRGIGEDTTYITKGTTINGNVESDGDIEILGRVEGNVRCGGKLIVCGRVAGDIDTVEVFAEQANIAGEIRASGMVKIAQGSVAVGNISAETAVIAGAVKGDVDIRDSVVVDSTAVIVGNIKSKSVQINSGAIIDGFCKQTYSDIDVDQYFQNGIEDLA